ncbi:MAG: Aspartyl-tRNA(Asn) amidotransferase subunit [Myxococcaceae bacterium]|nr:Aspartyl-tRNA(Asn) amidotransferase subunit [Myxococcaceae bacterium]
MVDLDLERIRHVATLAELSLTAEEERRLAGEIGRIVAYVAELEAIDTTDVPPTAHVAGIEPTRSEDGWRADVIVPGLSHEDALAGAPHAEHGGFAVPGFVE